MLAVNGHAKHRQSLCRVGYGKTALSMDLFFIPRKGGLTPPLQLACIFLFSSCHVLLLRKSTKTPGTRKKQSGGSLLTSRMRHSSVEPPLSLQPVRLLQGAAELILLIDNACSKWSRVAQT